VRRVNIPRNTFKHALVEGAQTVGIWSNLASSVAAEICAGSGFDWMLLDAEHAPNDIQTVLAGLQAAAAYETSVIVRPVHGDAVCIKQLLDIGAQTILVPSVDTPEHAASMVAAVSYPPAGVRGVASQTRAGRWGRIPNYLAMARDEICLIVQIESMEGLRNVDRILQVDGIDAVFVGPSDLAASMGHLGQPGHAEVQEAVAHVLERAKAAVTPVGILTLEEDLARRHLKQGFSFVGVGIDTMLLARSLTDLSRRFA
jgi:4-hydroxy-2-oxoheptanedioate aldolase